jgi:hypothetical protein
MSCCTAAPGFGWPPAATNRNWPSRTECTEGVRLGGRIGCDAAAGSRRPGLGFLTAPPTSVPVVLVAAAGTRPRYQRAGGTDSLLSLAHDDTTGLLAVADTTTRPVHITAAAFTHTADAKAGTATATATRNEMDDTFNVVIVFADHTRETIEMLLANPSSAHSWRLGIGTPIAKAGRRQLSRALSDTSAARRPVVGSQVGR